MCTGFFLLLLSLGGGQSALIVSKRPKGNSDPPSEPGSKSGALGPSFFGPGMKSDHTPKKVPESAEESCSYENLLLHLNLKKSERYQMARPVRNYSDPVLIYLEVVLYAILDVRESDQTFAAYVLTFMSWINEQIRWKPMDYCGLDKITIPSELLWKPDITIEEMTEKDKSTVSPYVTVYSHGLVEAVYDRVLSSSCRMHVYQFPFDSQHCNLTFKSFIHSAAELNIAAVMDSEKVSAWTRKKMRTQFEWLFVDMKVTNGTVVSFDREQDVIVYTIQVKRRSVLYIVNFILPVMFFLVLDFASFLMSDTGEKLGFKITVLLAVTVMQLLLNEILPCSSDRIPLIAVYCIAIFTLMLVSLLETILVIYLIGKDSDSSEQDFGDIQAVKKNFLPRSDESLLDKKSSMTLTEECTLEMVAQELKDVKESLCLILNRGPDQGDQTRYWAQTTKKINRYFLVIYACAVFVFLTFLLIFWIH